MLSDPGHEASAPRSTDHELSAGQTPEGVSHALQNILEQILSNTEIEQNQLEEESEVKAELLQVARDYQDEPFSRSPIVECLVAVITRRIQPLTPGQSLKIQQAVARTLYEDVASRTRIERLWDHLKRLVSDDQ